MKIKPIEEIQAGLQPIADEMQIEIVEVEFKQGKDPALTVYIDTENGVDLDTCEKFHRAIDEPLDEIDPTFGEPYTLNVSSPGLDRPLKTARDFQKCMGEKAERKTVYLNVAEGTDLHQLTAGLLKDESVVSASVSEDAKLRFATMIESLNLVVVVIIICAGFLAFIVLYNLTNINITERIREIATIKVLGFYKNETASYIFRENIILTSIGALAGLLVGKIFHAFVMSQIQVDQVAFAVRVLPLSYLFSILLTLVFAFLVNLVMSRKLDKISMTESLKSVD